jgi:penicillin amidase
LGYDDCETTKENKKRSRLYNKDSIPGITRIQPEGNNMLNHTRFVAALFLVAAASVAIAKPIEAPGLDAPVKVVRDVDGIPHIIGNSEHDVVFVQGFLHAQDRFFQMDFSRRQASGTLAELVGAPALASDTQLRTFGLRRAAQRSLDALTPEMQAGLQAYADGVNYFLATQPLPPEYTVLELSQVDPWTPLDSVAIGKLIAFGLSFDLDISTTEALISYQVAGGIVGFDGTALFFEDLFRTQPFDPAATVPDALAAAAPAASSKSRGSHKAPKTRHSKKAQPSAASASETAAAKKPGKQLDPAVKKLARDYMEKVRGIPLLENALKSTDKPQGSNEWAVAASRSASGKAMLANDPHLALNTPATWYQNHLRARPAGLDAAGSTFPGVPYIVLGQNQRIAWGATVNPMDVTDTFQEQVVPDGSSPSGLSTIYLGSPEPVIPIPEVFRYNVVGDGTADNLEVATPGGTVNGVFIPPATLIVPRRNDGPIITIDPATGFALSVQYTGFSPTRELDAFRYFNFAKGLDDFQDALQFFDFGSQNFAYMDTDGNIAYFTSAEMPIREDLQAGTINGLPPYLIRNGTGGNEWLPVMNPQPQQAVPYEILPFDEMPKLINPPGGYFINANNDPTGNTRDNNAFNEPRPGGGIFYLNPGYAIGTRAGRITQGFEERLAAGPLTREDMEEIQADVILLDAQVFTPLILGAFENAQSATANPLLAAIASDPRVAEAIGRLQGWDYSTPTGVAEGYDASDEDGERSAPSAAEVEHSIAATIYSVWRGQMIGNTIDPVLDAIGLPRPPSSLSMTALRNLFDTFDTQLGVGASGLNFFNVPGVADAQARRDFLILKSVQDALNLLAGPEFAAAFGGSTEQTDYRWGRLHRIVLDHPLGPPFDTPPAGGAFPSSFPDLRGLAVDGGFGVVDASSHNSRADSSNDFMFGSGPSRRYIGESSKTPRGIDGQTTLPGGVSGVLGSPLYANILGRWLTNDYYDIRQRMRDVKQSAAETLKFVPPDDDSE